MEQKTTKKKKTTKKRKRRPLPACSPSEQELFSEREVEAIYRIPRKTLQSRRYEGQPPRFAKIGARIFYRREDLQAFLLENLHTVTSGRRGDRADA